MNVYPLGLSLETLAQPNGLSEIGKEIKQVAGEGPVLVAGTPEIVKGLAFALAKELSPLEVHVRSLEPFDGAFRRPLGIGASFFDREYSAVVSVSPPNRCLFEAKVIEAFFRGTPRFVLPFQWAENFKNPALHGVSLGPDTPTVVNLWPWAGSGRANHVVRGLLNHLSMQLWPSATFHHRRLADEVFSLDNNYRTLFKKGEGDRNIADRYLDSCFNLLDKNHYVVAHETMPPSLLQKRPNMRGIYLVRDPRDIVVSLYRHIMRAAAPDDLQEIRELNEEDGLLRVIEGFDYISKRRDFFHLQPSIREMTDWFVEAMSLPNVFVLKFEDIRQRPMEIYRELYNWLAGEDQRLMPLSEERLAQYVELGTFDKQSGGVRSDGDGLSGDEKKTDPFEMDAMQRVFRKGIVGDWQNHFTPRINEIVEMEIGDQLRKLGYA